MGNLEFKTTPCDQYSIHIIYTNDQASTFSSLTSGETFAILNCQLISVLIFKYYILITGASNKKRINTDGHQLFYFSEMN